MVRMLSWLGVVAAGSLMACAGMAAEVVEPKVAQADADFAVQGEYLGEGDLLGGKTGAQVVAQGDGKFDVYLLKGGLPGEGWKRGDRRIKLEASRDGAAVKVGGQGISGQIAQGNLSLRGDKGRLELKRVERKSPTLGKKAPAGATLLFLDGKGVEHFDHGDLSPLGALLSGVTTKKSFGDYQLHVEFMLSWMPTARGQGRSNSGVYVHDCYEIQVLDSFGLEGANNECGGFYSIKVPDVNMCFPPLTWQTYDVDYTAPKYDAAGAKIANARITVKHNGVAIHDNVELPKGTPGRKPEGPGPRPLHLQGHGNKVQYNNLWLQEKN